MNEGERLPFGPCAWFLIDQLQALPPQIGPSFFDVLNLQADVVDAFSPLL
jgi:hypothetical protein